MIILDTDHIVVLKYSNTRQRDELVRRMDSVEDHVFATTVITLEEQMRGWLALIQRMKEVTKQVSAYMRLAELVEFYSSWQVVPFDDLAAREFVRFRQQRIRVATMDLKIASIAIANDALLLTANTTDFERVPGLRFEDWLQ